MRAMPFRVPDPGSAVFAPPQVMATGGTARSGEQVPAWDYLTHVTVSARVDVDAEQFLRATGLPTFEGVHVVLLVDCPATGFRAVRSTQARSGEPTWIEIEVLPHLTAVELEVRQGVALIGSITSGDLTVAHQAGSRLLMDARVHRFPLEGAGVGFPIEAFDFAAAGQPAGAVWRLNFRPDDLSQPYATSVRLWVNTGHPAADELLRGRPGLEQSVLFNDVLAQMFMAVAASESITRDDEYGEGTVGAVLDELADQFLSTTMWGAVEAFRADQARFLAKLQSATRFLRTEA